MLRHRARVRDRPERRAAAAPPRRQRPSCESGPSRSAAPGPRRSKSAIDEGVVRRDLDVHSAYWFIRGAMWFTVRWFDPGGAISVDEIIEQFHEFIQMRLPAERRDDA